MQIKVKLRNTSPVFSAAPGASALTLDGKLVAAGTGFPYIRARRAGVLATDADVGTRWAEVPVVPSNSMRNLLRRIILAESIEPALVEKRSKLSIGAYATAYSGNQTGNPDGVPSSFDEIATMRQHPFIGLFGGGPRMLRGRMSCGHLYPIHQDALRVIGEEYQDEAAKGSLTQPVWTTRKDPVEQIVEPEQTEVIDDGVSAVNQWVQATLEAASANKKKGDDSEGETKDARGLKAMNAHEVVIPGVSWLWRIDLDRPSNAQLGLVLHALSKLGNWTVAGGNAKGYGNVELESIILNGTEIWSAGQFDDSVLEYFDAMAGAIDELTAAAFEQFAASRKSKNA